MIDKPKILIVDDVAQNLHLLTQMLKDSFKIIVATNGEKAIELARKDIQPDVILLDVMMPDIDGYEVCRILKSDPHTLHIPIIFVTSLNSIEDQDKGLALGGADYITKPISKNILIQRLNTQLRLFNLEKHQYKPIKEAQMQDTNNQILIVDDTPENIQVMIEILKEDYKVSVATSGEKVFKLLSNGSIPDLILLDILMPNIDGFEVCKRLQSDSRFNHIPIIFVTVLESEKDIVKGLELGAVDYVTKPVEPAVVKARVKTHLKLKAFQESLLEDIEKKDALIIQQSKLATMGEMFENIIHQWKQPLSLISMVAGSVRMNHDFGQLDTKVLVNSLNEIEEATQYLAQTTDDFKSFLNDDQHKEYFHLDNVIKSTLKLVSLNSITINSNIEHYEFFSYKNELIQILINIFNNSKYALMTNNIEHPIININYSITESNHIIITICDNAGGIDDAIIDQIFDKYFTSKGSKGTGLGLYMCKTLIIKKFNGMINAYNEDDGACFELTIPLQDN